MPNRLRLTGILNPPADDGWRPGEGYVRFDPADAAEAGWSVPGYRPAWPIVGTPGILGNALIERNGGDLYVPGDEPGTTYAGPRMKVSYHLQTTAGDWYTGSFLWRAVSLGGGTVDLRTPPPEGQPPVVSRPGTPAGALLTSDLDNLVPSKAAFDAAFGSRGQLGGLATLDESGWVRQALAPHGINEVDWNTFRAGGLFDAVRGANRPTPSEWHYLINVPHRNPNGFGLQFAIALDTEGGGSERLFMRRQLGGRWQTWRNLVVIAEQTEVNGLTCLRYADGRQELYGNLVLAPATGGGGFDVTFPRAFLGSYTLNITNGDWQAFRGYLSIWTTASDRAHVVATLLDGTPRPVGVQVRLHVHAVGRWY